MDAADHQVELSGQRRIQCARPPAFAARKQQFAAPGLGNDQQTQRQVELLPELLKLRHRALRQIQFGEGRDQRSISGQRRPQKRQRNRG